MINIKKVLMLEISINEELSEWQEVIKELVHNIQTNDYCDDGTMEIKITEV